MENTKVQAPGILNLFARFPNVAPPLLNLAQTVLFETGSIPIRPGYREVIAAYAAKYNDCKFCYKSHRAFAEFQIGKESVVRFLDQGIFIEFPKMERYLEIANRALYPSPAFTPEYEAERNAQYEITEAEENAVVLIAAMMTMFNRWVDGMFVGNPPLTEADYDDMAEDVMTNGYVR